MPCSFSAGRLEYQAQSPDENALVSAAKNFGFVFVTRPSGKSITLAVNATDKSDPEIPFREETYELPCLLDFSSDRKRMSALVKRKRDNKCMLYCKGRLDVRCSTLVSL